MKVVLAHDYLIQMGGAERVVACMHERFPAAPIYTSAVCRRTLWPEFADAKIHTTWLQYLPWIEDHTHFKKYFPLYPAAFRSFGRITADRAWVSTSTFAKFLRFTPGTQTIAYIHNPTRFLWQTDDYLDHEVARGPLSAAVRLMLPILRSWDRDAARRMDVLVANSRNVQERIQRCYQRESVIIPPPVRTESFALSPDHDGSYLIVSRLIGYKNIDLAVRAFSASGRRLVVLGDGPRRPLLERLAGPNVRIAGRVPDDEVRAHFARCRAFVFPGHEDFGITPVEAMACGKPVVALARGGALETVVDGHTGVYFEESTEEALNAAVSRCEQTTWDPHAIRAHAQQFSTERFLRRMEDVLGVAD